jgi:7-cyano-7-deazaguanine reductase
VSSAKQSKRYGEKAIAFASYGRELEFWLYKPSRFDNLISIKMPEFTCLCPRSGYPDFATIHIKYIPRTLVVELKALKLWLNSFRDRRISHEDSTRLIFEVLEAKLKPKSLTVMMDFNPRGNVHTICEMSTDSRVTKKR